MEPPISDQASAPLIIFGGGQLSQMLVEAARPMGVSCYVVSDDPAAPALAAGGKLLRGNARDVNFLKSLFSGQNRGSPRPSAVTFENEFIDTEPLRHASAGANVAFYPSLACIEALRDKLEQKVRLRDAEVPATRFVVITKGSSVSSLNDLQETFPNGFVLKWSRFGYDGKGTWISPSVRTSEGGFLSAKDRVVAWEFVEMGWLKGAEVFAEEKIPFTAELAIVGARSVSGEMVIYPLVLSEQRDGICQWVKGPASALGIDAALEKTATGYMCNLLSRLDYVGVLACEMFLTKEGALLVNELAPRVHNSGHYTQDGASVSQFHNHVLCVTGQAPQIPQVASYFMMGNLIGPQGCVDLPGGEYTGPSLTSGLSLHWYGKSLVRTGRKMGHINGVASNSSSFTVVERDLRAAVAAWEQECLKQGRDNG